MTTTLAPDTNELRRISGLHTELALRRAAPFLARLVQDPTFLEVRLLPLLEEARHAEGWYVARRWDAPDGSFSLQVFVWPPGTRTRIHDHSSWGAYACAVGTVLEERYERLDDGSRPDHARLRKVWELRWAPGDGVSTVLPGDGGIHRVSNPGEGAAISVHLYGPRTGEVDGRDYDPSCDHVCDRREDWGGVRDARSPCGDRRAGGARRQRVPRQRGHGTGVVLSTGERRSRGRRSSGPTRREGREDIGMQGTPRRRTRGSMRTPGGHDHPTTRKETG